MSHLKYESIGKTLETKSFLTAIFHKRGLPSQPVESVIILFSVLNAEQILHRYNQLFAGTPANPNFIFLM